MTAAGAPVSYAYDAQGRRVKKTVSGTVTDYFYSGAEVIAEKNGSTWTDYIFLGSQRIAKQTGSSLSTTTFLHSDHLGSVRVATNSSGTSVGACEYEPFGEVQPGTTCSVGVDYRFAGMAWDSNAGPNGLYYTWFRRYDINQGRWMGVDPLAGSANTPQSLDRFAYVSNDPAAFKDPLGLAAVICPLLSGTGDPDMSFGGCDVYGNFRDQQSAESRYWEATADQRMLIVWLANYAMGQLEAGNWAWGDVMFFVQSVYGMKLEIAKDQPGQAGFRGQVRDVVAYEIVPGDPRPGFSRDAWTDASTRSFSDAGLPIPPGTGASEFAQFATRMSALPRRSSPLLSLFVSAPNFRLQTAHQQNLLTIFSWMSIYVRMKQAGFDVPI